MTRRSLVLSLAFSLAFAVAPGVRAQTPPSYRAALYVDLSRNRETTYGSARKTAAISFGGEPLSVHLGIRNPYADRSVGAEENWPELVLLTLYAGSTRSHERIGTPLRCTPGGPSHNTMASVSMMDGYVLLNDMIVQQYVTCDLSIDELNLKAGIYTLEVNWKPDVDRRLAQRNTPTGLAGFSDFEYRPVSSDDDSAELALRLAARANDDGRFEDAQGFINEVLRLRPLSAVAITMRADVRVKTSDCRGARTDLMLAADIFDSLAEPEDRANARRDATQRRSLAMELRRQALQLSCER